MAPEALVIDLPGSGPGARTVKQRLEMELGIPAMPTFLLIHQEALDEFDLTWGADDFVVVPGAAGELSVRIRLLFWTHSRIRQEGSIEFGALSLDFANYEVRVGGDVIPLTFKEFELFKYLVTHRSRVHTRESLLARVWGYDYYGGTRTVDVHIRRIRTKLGEPYQDCVSTVRGVGYRFTPLP
ncbi:MAG: response regulator transcription factor [Armatimonadetes bacterium]|nr:response regulator transcription factor [Armatimonadota bacterium]